MALATATCLVLRKLQHRPYPQGTRDWGAEMLRMVLLTGLFSRYRWLIGTLRQIYVQSARVVAI